MSKDELYEKELARLQKLYPDKKIEFGWGEFFIRDKNGNKCYIGNQSNKVVRPKSSYEKEKAWLDQIAEWTKIDKNTDEFYVETLKELKEKYGIKD